MLTETERYQLSLYETEQVISESKDARIEKVRSSFDGKFYIKRIYKEDKREIFKILQKIENPYLPKIHAIFFDEDTILIEEYIEGIPLSNLLAEKKLTASQTETIAKGLLSALESLHVHNVIHRDIKPENILIAADGAPKLIDFGVARIYREHETKDTSQFGTHGYAAPEQYGFGQSDFRTDIYSFGVTLNRMIAISGGSSGRFKQMADKCAEFDPKNRFGNVEEIVRFWDGKQSNFSRRKIFIFAAVFFIFAVGMIFINSVRNQDTNMSLVAEQNTHNPPLAVQSQNAITQQESPPTTRELGTPTQSEEKKDALGFGYHNPVEQIFKKEDGEAVPSLLFLAERGPHVLNIKVDFGKEVGMIYIYAMLNGDTLHIVMRDDRGNELAHDFQNDYASPPHAGLTYPIDAEVVFADLDEDGKIEILFAVAERKHFGEFNGGMKLYLYGSIYVWCVQYSERDGFALLPNVIKHGEDLYAFFKGVYLYPDHFELKTQSGDIHYRIGKIS